jgi:hypothetical protein
MIQYQRQSQLRYNNNNKLLASLVLGIILLFAIFSTAITSPSSYLYAQQQQQQQQLQNGTTTSATSAIGVKITSPARDQQVPVGSLKISGTSKENATSNDCTVYALWDDLKPYQKVEPTGPSGQSDYSNWTFTYTKNYHLISPGINELTAKITCLANPSNITKFYSVNVTGVGGGAAANQNQESPPSITNNPTGPLSLPEPSVNLKENNLVLISLSIPRPLTPKDL